MKREPIWCWMEREKGISFQQWNDIVDVAAEQYLKELNFGAGGPRPHSTYAELKQNDPISADEIGGSVERIVAKAFGWTSYESRPDDLPELSLAVQMGRGGEFIEETDD